MAAASREFFSRFRHFGSSLERDCNELKARLEDNDAATDNEGRCHLLLREVLSEVVGLKENAVSKVSKAKEDLCFGDFLDACERLAEHTKSHIDDIEGHLLKYGYKKTGDLPAVESIYEINNDNDSQHSLPTETESTESSSNEADNNDVAMETDNKDADNEMPCPAKKAKLQEEDDDPMKSPIRPDTFTPMIQLTPLKLPGQTANPSSPMDSPLPPQTTTPMIKVKTSSRTTETSTEPSTPNYFKAPQQPQTMTPMIKTKLGAVSTSGQDTIKEESSPDQSPAPPMLSTPGLKMMGVSSRLVADCQSLASPAYDTEEFDTPTLPDVTSVILLRPEDIKPPVMESFDDPSSALSSDGPNATASQTVPPVSHEEHAALPSYIKKQFSVENMNHLLEKISQHLDREQQAGRPPKLSEQELNSMFALGAKTKAFMLALGKLSRAKFSKDQVIFII